MKMNTGGHPYKRGSTSQQSIFGGKGHQQSLNASGKPKQKKGEPPIQTKGQCDYSLVAPIRQTASIFKQPVTVFKEHKSKVKAELKAVSREKPSQLFWTRRLISRDEDNEDLKLPVSLRCVGPGITPLQVLASISTHLHVSKDPALGQGTSEEAIEKNPGAFVNPSQPLVSSVSVADDEIIAQEKRVNQARQKLAQAIKALG